MATDPNAVSFEATLQRVGAGIKASRDAFREAIGTDDSRLEREAKKRTEPYFAPENRRDLFIQEAGRTLVGGIREFGNIRAGIVQNVAALGITMNQVAWGTELEMLRGLPVIPGLTAETDAASAVRSALEGLNETQRRNAGLAARAALIGVQVSQMTQAAASLLIMRRGEVELYVQGVAQVDVAAGVRAVAHEVATEAGYEVLGEIVRQAALAVVTTIPIAAIVVGVVRVIAGVDAELHALQTKYRRTELDEMFAFSRRVPETNRVATEVQNGLGELLDGAFLTP